jgi:hypothetical protein
MNGYISTIPKICAARFKDNKFKKLIPLISSTICIFINDLNTNGLPFLSQALINSDEKISQDPLFHEIVINLIDVFQPHNLEEKQIISSELGSEICDKSMTNHFSTALSVQIYLAIKDKIEE